LPVFVFHIDIFGRFWLSNIIIKIFLSGPTYTQFNITVGVFVFQLL